MRTFLLAPLYRPCSSLLTHTGHNPETAAVAVGPLRPSGSVSASGASTLDDLQAQLAQKPTSRGDCLANNAAGGGNKLAGSAIIYK